MSLTPAFRMLLRMLPGWLMVAGAAQVVAAVLAWGAAEHVEIPAWATTFVGLCFGVPALGLGLVSLHSIWQATRRDFSPAWLLLVPGAVALLGAILVLVVLAALIGEPSTYDNLRDPDGTINLSPSGFLFIGIFAAIILVPGIAFPVFLYGLGVAPNPRTKFDREPDEYDAIAEMMKGRRRLRTPR